LLVLLKDVLNRRKDLKLVLMSATLDAGIFEAYFGGRGKVGLIEIQGRTYPVEDIYIDDIIRMTGYNMPVSSGPVPEDSKEADPGMGAAIRSIGDRINYDFIAQTVRHIDKQLGDKPGGILIFLPGTMEISRTIDAIRSIPNIHALPLHASLQSVEQRRVFPPAPKGKRKVIAATNVAETSITIEDIVAVIDTGRVKETSFDPQNNMIKLEEVWASRAACKQRRGRAGRVRAGECYKLYTRQAEMNKMAERPDPEIRRVPLEQMCLSVKATGVKDVPAFLQSALTPPDVMAVDGAMDLLRRIGALDGDEMTALGRHLSMIPADLRCGKLMVYGATFGCLEACLTLAAILTVRSPFMSPREKREESKAARAAFSKVEGDLIADLHAYEQWSTLKGSGSAYNRDLRSWCDQNFLNNQTLSDISTNRTQYLSSLKDTGFLPQTYHSNDAKSSASYNKHNTNSALIRALVAGAFNPQIARIAFPEKKFAATSTGAMELDPEAKTIRYFNQENGRVFVHPSSILFDAQGFGSDGVFMSYFNKMATSKVFIRELTREFPILPEND
jgi:ATP-dependent RNA helicase DHX57